MTSYTWLGVSGPFSAASFWRVNGGLTGGIPGTADTALFASSGAYAVSGVGGVDQLIVTAPSANLAIIGTIGFSPAGAVQNAGTLTVSGQVSLGHNNTGAGAATVAFANTGTITGIATSDLTLFGIVPAGGLGSIAMNGGTLRLGGSIDNAGATLSAGQFGAGSLFIEGTVHQGTILVDGHLTFATDASMPTALLLDGVTLRGSYGGLFQPFVQNGLTITDAAGTGPGTLSIGPAVFDKFTNTRAVGMEVIDSETLDNLTINLRSWAYSFTSPFYAIKVDQTLTFGTHAVLATVPVLGLSAPLVSTNIVEGNTIVSNGIIALAGNAGLLISTTTFINNGTIGGGGTLTLGSTNVTNTGIVLPDTSGYRNVSALVFNNSGTFTAGAGLLDINGQGRGQVVGGTVVTNSGTIAATGGTITVNGNIAGTGTIDLANGGTANLRGLYDQQHFALHGTGNVLTFNAIGGTNTITGFTPGDSIVLTGTPADVTFSSGTLTISTSGITLATFAMPDVPGNAQFTATAGANTTISETIPCFAAGTRIATPSGTVAVEHLRIGDEVLSAFGGSVPIQWIGHRRAQAARHPRPETVWPIRIAAGALADGVPRRDLFVSPDHALHLDGHLIPAGLLINGLTITQPHCDRVTYFHLELPQHDVVLAEGAACESYLDTNNRRDFDNAEVTNLHPDFTPDEIWRTQACAPQCRSGTVLDRLRLRLARRAACPPATEGPRSALA